MERSDKIKGKKGEADLRAEPSDAGLKKLALQKDLKAVWSEATKVKAKKARPARAEPSGVRLKMLSLKKM